MPTGIRREAFGAYYFSVQIGNSYVGYFRSCSGLKSEAEVVEIAEGGLNSTTHKLIGRTKFPNLVLKQGFCHQSYTLWQMRKRFLEPDESARFTGTVTQLGPNGNQAKWGFEGGWICKWEGPELDASKNEVSIESIEIAHDGLISLA